ncbi:hypothetical protein [Streptomyces sp. NPDC047070]|uniref:hypothetical protein n=1 Tax=Streptomyces sp. NPDC047070 TaxID=3154923 RepID=UPI003455CBEF
MTTASPIPPPDEGTPLPSVEAAPAQAAAMTRSYDGMTVDVIAQSAAVQARVEAGVELTAMATLVEGRPPGDLVRVSEIESVLDGSAPAKMPLTLAWNGEFTDPDGDGPGEATLIGAVTSRGVRAVLALTPDERLVLGAQLLATLHTAEACSRSGCGSTADELDGSGPPLFGWIRVQVAGVDGPPRWWCSPMCVHAAMAEAGAETAAADQAAAVDPGEQAPIAGPLYGGDLAAWVATAHDNDADREADAQAEDGQAPEYLDGATLRLSQGLASQGGAL